MTKTMVVVPLCKAPTTTTNGVVMYYVCMCYSGTFFIAGYQTKLSMYYAGVVGSFVLQT